MKKLIWLFCLIFYSGFSSHGSVAIGQEKEKPPQTFGNLNWEINTDLLWLAEKNHLPDYSLQVKRYVRKGKPTPGAIRLRLALEAQKDKSAFYSWSGTIEKTWHPYFDLGYQWTKQYGRHQFFYGADLHWDLSYYHEWKRGYDDIPAGENFSNISVKTEKDTYEKIATYGLKGVWGYHFFVSPKVSFGLEGDLSCYYRKNKDEMNKYFFHDNWQGSILENRSFHWSMSLLPINSISVCFHL